MYDIIQNNFTDILPVKIVICVYFYGPIKTTMLRNTSFLPHFHCVWYDEDLGTIYQKLKNFDLGSYFCL